MSRVKWKGVYFNNKFFRKFFYEKKRKKISKKAINLFQTSLKITKIFINKEINLYRGNSYRKIVVDDFMVGFRFGELLINRRPFKYIGKIKKKGATGGLVKR